MSEKLNLYFEEYKLLKEEARIYADVNFRDLQILVVVLAAFIALAKNGNSASLNDNAWVVTIGQMAVFLFLLIQSSRIVYLWILRTHLASIEKRLQGNNVDGQLTWENKIVPDQVSNRKALNTHIQAFILIAYATLFVLLSIQSFDLSRSWDKYYLYRTAIVVEILFFVYIGIRELASRTQVGNPPNGEVDTNNEPLQSQ